MKKFGFKTRAQWEFFRSALIGVLIGILIAPTAAGILNKRENPDANATSKESFAEKLAGIMPNEKTKIIINGKLVAIAKGRDVAENAFKSARLAYNAEGVKLLALDVSYEPVDKEKDIELIKSMKVKRGEELTDTILDSLSEFDDDKELAYTMRIDDYTVTVGSFEELVAMLEKTQARYDENDNFQVGLNQPASHNVTMYEVEVTQKAAEKETPDNMDGAHIILPAKVNMTGQNADEQGDAAENEANENAAGDEADENAAGDEADENAAEGESGENAAEDESDNNPEETGTQESVEDKEQLDSQAADDGVKFVGFSEKIQVTETYVRNDQITDSDRAYQEITSEMDVPDIYVVKPGDALGLIAEKYNMTLDEIKELNPGIESDDNIFYDDRLNVTVPRAVVQVMVQKQETYEEEYNADIVYEDDASRFIGDNVVLEEGSSGRHIVTDLVTYDGDMEKGREQLKETVEVAAVAQVVLRGTKSRPTYMYPVTNWNITSNFGYRWGRLHAGTDVGVPIGTTVRASRAGQVTVAGWVGGYGNCVMIDHGDGITTVYGHLSEINCSAGQYVDQGQQIALSGNTGRSTGPHLHFEVRVNGVAEDAMPYLWGEK